MYYLLLFGTLTLFCVCAVSLRKPQILVVGCCVLVALNSEKQLLKEKKKKLDLFYSIISLFVVPCYYYFEPRALNIQSDSLCTLCCIPSLFFIITIIIETILLYNILFFILFSGYKDIIKSIRK